MALPRIRLSPAQRDDLAVICRLGKDRLSEVAEVIEGLKSTIKRDKIDAALRETVRSETAARALSRFLFGLAGAFRQNLSTPEESIEAVSRAVDEARDSRFENWEQCRPAITRLLKNQSVSLAAKALNISYDFERLYIAGRLVTSIRPVFDDPREEILGSTIVQTLRIEFADSGGHHRSISIAMDLDDIQQLLKSCQSALKKAAKAKSLMEDGRRLLEAIVPGEDEE